MNNMEKLYLVIGQIDALQQRKREVSRDHNASIASTRLKTSGGTMKKLVICLALAASGCAAPVTKQQAAPVVPERTYLFQRVNGHTASANEVSAVLAAKLDEVAPGAAKESQDGTVLTLKYALRTDSAASAYGVECKSEIKLRASQTSGGTRVVLTPPQELTVTYSKRSDWQNNSLGILAETAAQAAGASTSDEERFAAGSRACDSGSAKAWAVTEKVQLSYVDEFGGEIDAPYSDDVVYANFERKLPKSQWTGSNSKTDVEKTKVFKLQDGGIEGTISIAVYPRPKGSKLVYVIRVPYVVASDGTSSFSIAALEHLRHRIAEIAND